MKFLRQFTTLLSLIVVASFGAATLHAQLIQPLTVFAAASLQNALEDAGKAFTAKTGTPVRFSFAASSRTRTPA